jgi:type 1 glutamine amidotransferase
MLVGGQAHDYENLPVQLADRLARRGNMTVEVTSDLASIHRKSLERIDVFIVNTCHRPELNDEFKRAVIEHVRSGKGLVVVHCSLWSYLDWPEWTEMIGGRVETHDKYGTYEVVVLDPGHATMLSLGNRFAITDEPYLVDEMDPNATVLIEAAEPRRDTQGELRSGPDPQVWVKSFGKGRIYVTTFGHDAASQESEQFMTLLHNGIRWAGGRIQDTVHNRLCDSERQAGFASLFNGHDLSGWQGGNGLWSVENGELVGRGENLNRCNFLMPDARYGDFVLRFAFKLVEGNSGVQIRSIEQPDDPARPLQGYHVDIVREAWGSLYDYGGPRGVLSKILPPEQSRRLVIPNGWNDMTVQAAGPQITVWVNGVATTRFKETIPEIPRSGVIGFQLHRGQETTEIRLRDIRIRALKPDDLEPQSRPD